MLKVVHTLTRWVGGGNGRLVGGGFVVFGGFVDIKEGLAGRGVGFVWSLAVGTLKNSVGAGLSSCVAGGADMEASIVFTSTKLASKLLPANC